MLLKFVFRNIRKRPFLNFIKVFGLALGLSGILFIALFLKNELTYDAWHKKADRIYRITFTNPNFLGNSHFARIPNSEQIPALAEYFPEVENYVRLAPIRGGVMVYDEKYYTVNQAFECDSTFFDLFDGELLIGEKQSVLNAPGSMVISESFAKRVFGTENPTGEIISVPPGQFYGEKMDFTVKGVMKDFPQNSHFHPDLITTPAEGQISWWAWAYLLLSEHADPGKITSGYAGFLADNSDETIGEIQTNAYLQKLTDIHLHSDKLREIEPNGNMTNLVVLGIAALILLLISVSNYSSLNLGMSGFNRKFITINRILGSTRNTNLKYLMLESLIIVGTAMVLAVLIAVPVNSLIHTHFNINLFKSGAVVKTSVFVLFGLLGIIAGLHPWFVQQIEKMKPGTNIPFAFKSVFVSRAIIISQFTLAIVLIVAVFVITRQTGFVLNNSMGVRESNIICFESVHASVQQKFELFKAELLKYNTIESVSAMLEPPGGEANDMFPFEMEGREQEDGQNNQIGVFPCDYSFAEIFNLKFLAGRNFSEKNVDTEGSGEYLINEAAMRFLNHSNPDEIVSKSFKLNFNSPDIEIPRGKIIGVVKDFHLSSMKKKVGPLVMFKRDGLWLINFVVSHKPGMRNAAIADMKKVWNEMFPAYPFQHEEVGIMYQNVYKTELLQARLLTIFTFISLFICCVGLLGLSLLVAQQKVKEIGIRKVNGAKISEVLVMLNRDFVKWVAIAFVIATPISYYAMHKWLENFAYKTELSWWIFALAGLFALGIALLTVSWQSWRAATKNPVEALRYE